MEQFEFHPATTSYDRTWTPLEPGVDEVGEVVDFAVDDTPKGVLRPTGTNRLSLAYLEKPPIRDRHPLVPAPAPNPPEVPPWINVLIEVLDALCSDGLQGHVMMIRYDAPCRFYSIESSSHPFEVVGGIVAELKSRTACSELNVDIHFVGSWLDDHTGG
ncbi:hypothetical protein NM208_g10935 [Fusarium decemcellulare]|uniref:Uncharacterized protein n=1 Tax=Fusarium decemcellulare TaxID=57161 RepID=A0ACC1RW40_9HYPO|nr:hypothetical protein NM208_g10935 [Fusarium decemcellulare]